MTSESPVGPAMYGWFSVLAIALAFGIVGRILRCIVLTE